MSISVLKNYEPDEGMLVGNSQFMKDLKKMVKQLATVDCTVLLMGESGTGKEVVVTAIHEYGKKSGPIVKVNCGAIPENLLESELFGYEQGAFTGAKTSGKAGKFEEAHNGTLFLDEIGEMPLHLQVKLLRVLQEKEVIRVGGSKTTQVNARILAATNKDLHSMVEQGKFREDLFYRLNVVPITIPPLRERKEDIMPLILHFKTKYQTKYQTRRNCSSEVVRLFLAYDWPGNVREMENLLERLIVLLDPAEEITPQILIKNFLSITRQQLEKDVAVNKLITIKEATEIIERELINMALTKYKTLKEVADVLGVDQSTICRKLKQLNISR